MSRFDRDVAIVTGAGSGIGQATARRLAAEGVAVLACDRDGHALETTVGDASGNLQAFGFDVTSKAGWGRAVDAAQAAFGPLTILVNGAGILRRNTIESVGLDVWNEVIGINTTGSFLGCQAVVPQMRQGRGAIVNISSVSGQQGDADLCAYDASKGAVRGFTRELAAYLARRGDPIRCNAIFPGIIETSMVRTFFSEHPGTEPAWQAVNPGGRYGSATDVAALICFLVSSDASFCTGGEFNVDGGATA